MVEFFTFNTTLLEMAMLVVSKSFTVAKKNVTTSGAQPALNAKKFECIHKILHVEQNRHCVDLGSKIYSRERKDKIPFLAQCVGILGGGYPSRPPKFAHVKLLNHLRTVS